MAWSMQSWKRYGAVTESGHEKDTSNFSRRGWGPQKRSGGLTGYDGDAKAALGCGAGAVSGVDGQAGCAAAADRDKDSSLIIHYFTEWVDLGERVSVAN